MEYANLPRFLADRPGGRYSEIAAGLQAPVGESKEETVEALLNVAEASRRLGRYANAFCGYRTAWRVAAEAAPGRLPWCLWGIASTMNRQGSYAASHAWYRSPASRPRRTCENSPSHPKPRRVRCRGQERLVLRLYWERS